MKKLFFKNNPYYSCEEIDIIEGRKMLTKPHVENPMIYHKDKNKYTKVIKYLDKLYGGLTILKGKEHNYLGIGMDFSETGKVNIYMPKYSWNIIKDFVQHWGKIEDTPATENLFQISPDENYKLLPEDQSWIFHREVSQLIFIFTQTRRDIINIVDFSSSGSKIHIHMTRKIYAKWCIN